MGKILEELIPVIVDFLLSYLRILPCHRVTAYWIDSIDSTTPRCLQSVCASESDYKNRSCENNQKVRVKIEEFLKVILSSKYE